jgi:hypothetical protein
MQGRKLRRAGRPEHAKKNAEQEAKEGMQTRVKKNAGQEAKEGRQAGYSKVSAVPD